MTLPGSNAAVERIFSQINSLWTKEKNRLSVFTVKSILVVKSQFYNIRCEEFHNMISKEKNFLQKIYSLEKYSKKQKKQTTKTTK